MNQIVLLDAGPLGLLTHRKGLREADACRTWLREGAQRGLVLRAGKTDGLARLDAFISAESGRYLPITTAVMRQAALFWADVRRRGQPTAPDPALDADAILAAQAVTLDAPPTVVVIATSNVGHLRRFVHAATWEDIR